MNTTGLRDYQIPHARALLDFLEQRRAALDASDTGTGKTFVALCLCRHLGITPFVVGPCALRDPWLRAADRMGWQVEFTNYERARGRQIEKGGTSHSEWGDERRVGGGSRWVWKNPVGMTIFDEVHRCGGSTTLNSKMLIASRRQSRYTLGLSATAADDPQQMKALGFALGLHNLANYHKWLLRHGCRLNMSGFGGMIETDPQHTNEGFLKMHAEIFSSCGARMQKRLIEGFPKTAIAVHYLDESEGESEELAAIEDLTAEIAATAGSDLVAHGAMCQALELRMVPQIVSLAEDAAESGSVVVFASYTATIDKVFKGLEKQLGKGLVGIIDGREVGKKRQCIVDNFQANKLKAVVVNSSVVGVSLQDPSGEVERTSFITPQYSGRTLAQIFGRVNRDGGAFSRQFCLYFNTKIHREIGLTVEQRLSNISLLNDAALSGNIPAAKAVTT